jgi:hypothetical protein
MVSRILTDEELDTLAKELLDGGPCGLPEGADADDTIDRLQGWAAGLQEVHIAEDTPGDGIILHA